MPGELVCLAARRALAELSDAPARVACAIQSAPGAVAFILTVEGEPREVWFTPEQAHELGVDFFNAAREAKRG